MDYSKLQNGSDIRGIALEGIEGQHVNLDEAASRAIGRGFALWLMETLGKKDLRVAVGRDSRLSGPQLEDWIVSAMAEEGVLAMALKDPSLLDTAKNLTAAEFSSSLLGNVYAQLRSRHEQGLDVSLAVLEELSGEEMSHITGICQRQTGPVNEDAFRDCVRIIQAEHRASKATTEDDIMALRKAYQGRKGINA